MARARSVRRRAITAIGLAGLVLTIAGCSLFYPFEDFEEFESLEPIATYTSGRATIEIDGETVVLDRLTGPAELLEGFGAEAVWIGEGGWYLRISGAMTGQPAFGETAWLTIDRIVDEQHWTTWDPSRCILTLDTVDETALRGSASCKDLRWSDAMGNPGFQPEPEPGYIAGEPAFDAEVTFEAEPAAQES